MLFNIMKYHKHFLNKTYPYIFILSRAGQIIYLPKCYCIKKLNGYKLYS